MIYLDHNATTPIHPEVQKTLVEAMDNFGNPSSMHASGRTAHAERLGRRAEGLRRHAEEWHGSSRRFPSAGTRLRKT